MKVRIFGFSLFVVLSLIMLAPSASFANNLTISNVQLGDRNTQAKTVAVEFDITWENSWRNKINHDAAWVIVRLSDAQSSTSGNKLCRMSAAGVSPEGADSGSNADAEVYVPADKVGAFIRRKSNAPTGPFSSTNVTLTVNYDSCGFSETSEIATNLYGIEMVFIPEGSFYAGDQAVSSAAFKQGSADSSPWPVLGEGALSVAAVAGGGYYYTSSSQANEFATGAEFTVPAAFPKGYNAFYVMKYEITEGQWVDFVSSIPAAARIQHDLTDNEHKNSDAVVSRNPLECSGSPLACSSLRSSRALNFLNWKDLCAYLDWAGLRPMTELEYEKIARGPYVPLAGEFAWGSVDIVSATVLSGTTEENGDELVVTPAANANYNASTFSGGDGGLGAEYQAGPLRGGIFATEDSGRAQSGAGNYGTMELSGNVSEQVISVGTVDALGFTGASGDGYLTTLTGFAGQADVSAWPGMDIDASKGVTSAAGSGLRGGSWADDADRLRISDRAEAALAVASATAEVGGRGVRSLD